MTEKLTTKNIAITLITVIVITVVASRYIKAEVSEALRDTEDTVRGQIAIQTERVRTIADATKLNQGDDVATSLVLDCSGDNRLKFDRLLDKLSADITRTELLELDSIFSDCANYTAEIKNIMAARLLQEVEIFDQHKQLLDKLRVEDESVAAKIDLWKRVAEGEQNAAKQYRQLVSLQRDIIRTLLAGKSKDSAEIKAILTQVTNVKNEMTVTRSQIENVRAELAAL